MRFEFQTGDEIHCLNPDSFDDDSLSVQTVLGTEELDDELEPEDGLMLRNVPVTQVLAVKYNVEDGRVEDGRVEDGRVEDGRVGVGMVTEVGIDFLLPLVSPVDWDMTMVVRGGERIHVGEMVAEVLGK